MGEKGNSQTEEIKRRQQNLPTKQCPTCKRNVSLTQLQWNLGAELPRDCPWCNKTTKRKDDKPKKYFTKESKPKPSSWLRKGASDG
jgi:uncharacterized paraquat-inducible protein A